MMMTSPFLPRCHPYGLERERRERRDRTEEKENRWIKINKKKKTFKENGYSVRVYIEK
jgi:hypothetical protein